LYNEKCEILFKLYIPHGSDESVGLTLLGIAAAITFISHMVQMKEYDFLSFSSNSSCLYIPHGSDER